MDTRAQTQGSNRRCDCGRGGICPGCARSAARQHPQAYEVIAEILTEQGLDARAIDGWVYVGLNDGRVMCISAEYGQSLEVTVYPDGRVLA